jgi:hypothetical protein
VQETTRSPDEITTWASVGKFSNVQEVWNATHNQASCIARMITG